MPRYFFPKYNYKSKDIQYVLNCIFCVYDLLTAQLNNPQHYTIIILLVVITEAFLFPLWIIFCVSSVFLISPMWSFLCTITVPYITYVSEIYATLLHPKVNYHAWLKWTATKTEGGSNSVWSTTFYPTVQTPRDCPLLIHGLDATLSSQQLAMLYAIGQLTFPS